MRPCAEVACTPAMRGRASHHRPRSTPRGCVKWGADTLRPCRAPPRADSREAGSAGAPARSLRAREHQPRASAGAASVPRGGRPHPGGARPGHREIARRGWSAAHRPGSRVAFRRPGASHRLPTARGAGRRCHPWPTARGAWRRPSSGGSDRSPRWSPSERRVVGEQGGLAAGSGEEGARGDSRSVPSRFGAPKRRGGSRSAHSRSGDRSLDRRHVPALPTAAPRCLADRRPRSSTRLRPCVEYRDAERPRPRAARRALPALPVDSCLVLLACRRALRRRGS